ncbi:MAG: alpha/beta fold hydrolase, partial [Clostridium sp.]
LIPPMLFMENTRFQCAKILENIKPVGKFGKWCKREQFLSSLILHSPFLTEERLKKISVPVLLMAGTHDLIKESHTRIIARCIPGSRLVLIKGVHKGFFKKKELYTGAISEFLFDKKEVRQD